MSAWEPVIGLELHVQLATASKIFSGAAAAFGAEPNAQACAVDLGMPGTLPVLNERALELAIVFGLAVDAEIARTTVFARKNYFYPDLPKGYQISQLDAPIVGRGAVEIALPDGARRTVRITRAHLEEDAGKSVHDAYEGLTGIDLNRAGTPLLEIVSEPDLRSAAEAAAYMRRIHALVRWLGVSDGNLEQGNFRCDANVSVRRRGSAALGTRTELKNINSFRFVERAIQFEIERQIEVLEAGGEITQETRLYDAEADETRSMRGKEAAMDYRYFPDPDLLPVTVEEHLIERLQRAQPELPWELAARLRAEEGLSESAAEAVAGSREAAAYFAAAVAADAPSRTVGNWMMGELAAALNRDGRDWDTCPLTPERLATLLARIEDGTISGKIAKALFERLWSAPEGPDVDAIIETEGLRQLDDRDELVRLVHEAVQANPKQVEQYRAGKTKVKGFFVGQVMKATRGRADPRQVDELLRAALGDPAAGDG